MGSVTRTALTVLVVVSVLGGQQAMASPLLLTFEGELSDVGGTSFLDPSIVVGASFSGSFSYDPAIEVDLYPDDSTYGAYLVNTTMIGKVGEVDYVTNLGLFVGINNNYGGQPADSLSVDGTGDGDWGGLPFTDGTLRLNGGPDVFDSDGLPSVLDLEDFDVCAYFEIYHYVVGDPGHNLFHAQGSLTSLTIVPEPASLLLLSLVGLLALGRRRRGLALLWC